MPKMLDVATTVGQCAAGDTGRTEVARWKPIRRCARAHGHGRRFDDGGGSWPAAAMVAVLAGACAQPSGGTPPPPPHKGIYMLAQRWRLLMPRRGRTTCVGSPTERSTSVASRASTTTSSPGTRFHPSRCCRTRSAGPHGRSAGSGRTRRSTSRRRRRSIRPRCRRRRRGRCSRTSNVMLIDLDHGYERTPVISVFETTGDRFRPTNLVTLLPYPGHPLRPDTRYAAVMFSGVKTSTGLNSVPAPLIAQLDEPWSATTPVSEERWNGMRSRARRGACRGDGVDGLGRVRHRRLHRVQHPGHRPGHRRHRGGHRCSPRHPRST